MKKIIMIGMNPRTRSAIPWDADAEFWSLNETENKDWLKKTDVIFQLHKRWDWDRSNNLSHPNHPLFIKGKPRSRCLYCKGTSKVYAEGKEVTCPWCKDGIYHIPDHRARKKIIMQDMNKDVPGCVKYPIAAIKKMQPAKEDMLTSTLAHMLAYAIDKNLKRKNRKLPFIPIELYGFEAESNTEYAVQRPGITYWIAYGRGLGMSIEAPGSHLLTGKHYGYEDFDQGYRSRLELRKRVLQENLNTAETAAVKSEGYLDALTPYQKIKRIRPIWEKAYDDHFKNKNMVSFIRGTIMELNKSIEILDAYRQDSDEATQGDVRRMIEIPYGLG